MSSRSANGELVLGVRREDVPTTPDIFVLVVLVLLVVVLLLLAVVVVVVVVELGRNQVRKSCRGA